MVLVLILVAGSLCGLNDEVVKLVHDLLGEVVAVATGPARVTCIIALR